MKHKEELQQLRNLTEKQLSGKINDSQKKLVELEQDKVLGKIKNIREITAVRKGIARMMTILDEKVREKI